MTESLTQEQVAALAGITTRRIRQIETEGDGIERKADGSYDPEAIGKWLRRRIMAECGVANDGKSYDYEAERARLTKAQADKTELEVSELRGELIRAPVIESHWQNMVAAMRAKILAIPSKIAPQVATPDKIQAVQEQIQAECFQALAEIAGDAFDHETRARIDSADRQADAGGDAPAPKADNIPVGKRKASAKSRG